MQKNRTIIQGCRRSNMCGYMHFVIHHMRPSIQGEKGKLRLNTNRHYAHQNNDNPECL